MQGAVGVEELQAFSADLYGTDDPAALPTGNGPLELTRDDEEITLALSLPFASRDDVDLARQGEELIVTVGTHRRVMALPTALRNLEIKGAGLRDGALRVRFGVQPA